MSYADHYRRNDTPQTEQADPRQKPNSAGGFTFVVDDWRALERLLILGTEGGTYYADERKLTRESAKVADALLASNPARVIEIVERISYFGRAPKNDAAIFVLALAASHANPEARACAANALPMVCRTGTHLFQFVDAVSRMRGWGRGLARTIKRWYSSHQPNDLMYQVVKYRNRHGWTHRDLLRKAHWAPQDPTLQAVVRWISQKPAEARTVKRASKVSEYPAVSTPDYLLAFDELQGADTAHRVIELVTQHRFPFEAIPTEWLDNPRVWEALLPDLPVGATLRNLGRLTKLGILSDLSTHVTVVTDRLTSESVLKKGRIHPIKVLEAMRVYQSGHGLKGKLTWGPSGRIVDALDAAFYASFATIEPTRRKTLVALDVSGSMGMYPTASGLTPREISAAMAMATVRTEQHWACVGFSHQLSRLSISPRQRLGDIIDYVSRIPMGATDCALPMLWAEQNGLDVEVFHVWTDNETFFGKVHPHEALRVYRQRTGINAKLAVMGCTATQFTIADPSDAGMLDVVGFSSDVPNLLADFARN